MCVVSQINEDHKRRHIPLGLGTSSCPLSRPGAQPTGNVSLGLCRLAQRGCWKVLFCSVLMSSRIPVSSSELLHIKHLCVPVREKTNRHKKPSMVLTPRRPGSQDYVSPSASPGSSACLRVVLRHFLVYRVNGAVERSCLLAGSPQRILKAF